MKAVCDRATLTQGIQVAAGIAPHRSPKPILGCVKLDAQEDRITLLATDLEVGIRISLDKIETSESGSALVPADRFHAILRELDAETVTLTANQQETEIVAPGARFKVLGDDPTDFPNVPDFPESGAFTIGADDLVGMIQRVVFATARENTRYALNGVLWNVEGKKLALVATDGRRLSMAKGKCEGGPGEKVEAIVPSKAMRLIERCLGDGTDAKAKAQVALSEKDILVKMSPAAGGCWVVYSRLVDGHFPKYEDVIPKDCDKKVGLATQAFLGGVRKAAVLTTEESHAIHLRFADKEVVLTSRTPEMGEAEVRVSTDYEGEPMEFAFAPTFLTDALKVMDSEEFTFAFKGSSKPGVMTEGRLFTYVVMPVSVV